MKKSKYNYYLITDPKYSITEIINSLDQGVTMVQIREKNIEYKDFLNKAISIQKECKKRKIPFIINDNLNIAIEVDADGLHVGQDDLNIQECRKRFPNKIIGVSARTYDEAIIAESNGADYIGVGSIFTTNTKSDAKHTPISEVKKIIEKVNIPIVLIGGLNIDNIEIIIDLDIDGLAISEGILNGKDKLLKIKEKYECRIKK